jgi:hypothetical protein
MTDARMVLGPGSPVTTIDGFDLVQNPAFLGNRDGRRALPPKAAGDEREAKCQFRWKSR